MTAQTELSVENVVRIVAACLPETKPATSIGLVEAQGVATHFHFERRKIDEHRDEIASMIAQIPKGFSLNNGGPGSFLKLCERANGTQWTSDQSVMDQLCCLAIASEFGEWIGNRKDWERYPGGMPYILFGEFRSPSLKESVPEAVG